ncbi:MAG: hypothetical protein J6331_06125 [Lentisphaeria bacterium]|nr:hypothetical protein [Lentisphaeria bacterium]
MKFCMGIDIGTTGVKTVLFDLDGVPRGTGLSEYALETPGPDIVELDPTVYWESVKKAVAQAVEEAKCDPKEIVSAGITGQAETLVYLGKDKNPSRKAVVWLDNRAGEEAETLKKAFSPEELFRMSGQTEMLPCWPAAKILHLKRHEEKVFAATEKYLMAEDYILWRLTGELATCRGMLPSTEYFDIRTGSWYRPMLDFLGITEENLPRLTHGGECAGIVKENDSLLPPGCVVSLCPIDHVCGNLGSGCCEEGMISETTGCTLALCAPFGHLVYDEARQVSTYLGSTKGSFVLLPWAPTAGMLLKYFRDEFASNLDYRTFDEEAAKVPAGSEGLLILPHMAGAVSPDCNPEARGVVYGLTLAHRKGHIARACMESVAYLLKDNLEAMKNAGLSVKELRSLGGASKSRLWLQIKADVLNIPVTVTECAEATSLGAAILGATAAKLFSSPAEGAKRMVRKGLTVYPSGDAEIYGKCFARYRKINRLLLPTFGKDE